MKKSLFIALKEVRSFFADRGDLAFALLLPIAIFALMVGAFGGSSSFNGTAYLVNEDHGALYSTLLIQRLEEYEGLTIETISAAEADNKLSRSDVQMILYIPRGFSDSLAASQPATLVFRQRGNGGLTGQIIANMVRGEAERIGQELQTQTRVKDTLADRNIDPQTIETTVQKFIDREASAPVVTITDTTVGSSPDPVNQFLPGILTMFVLFAVNLSAQALVEERRKGTLERLLSTRLRAGQLFMGKFLAYATRGFAQSLILLALAYLVFRFFTPLSFLEALIVALVFSASASAIGMIIGSISRTDNQAVWIAVFVTMAMVMTSGTFFPIPEGTLLHTLSRFSINTYANDAFNTIIADGGNLADVWMNLAVLMGVAVAGLALSRVLFRTTQGGK
ncbi:MAG: ABC transporter permease [Dehalococcoidales bacterium]|nr:ABC transporter permease [Dehalococcoidales bacterium]